MTKPVTTPGYQSKAERDLAAGLTAAKAEQAKAKLAAAKALADKNRAKLS